MICNMSMSLKLEKHIIITINMTIALNNDDLETKSDKCVVGGG